MVDGFRILKKPVFYLMVGILSCLIFVANFLIFYLFKISSIFDDYGIYVIAWGIPVAATVVLAWMSKTMNSNGRGFISIFLQLFFLWTIVITLWANTGQIAIHYGIWLHWIMTALLGIIVTPFIVLLGGGVVAGNSLMEALRTLLSRERIGRKISSFFLVLLMLSLFEILSILPMGLVSYITNAQVESELPLISVMMGWSLLYAFGILICGIIVSQLYRRVV